MKTVLEKETIEIKKYNLKIIVKDESKSNEIKDIIDCLDNDNINNFHRIAKIVDNGYAEIKRELTKEELDKIYDLNINGEFDKANRMEEELCSKWEIQFLNK